MGESVLIIYSSIIITLVILLISAIISSERKKNKEQIHQEYVKINQGDIYECKYYVDSDGIASDNPFNQRRYQVMCKKDGWVSMKSLDNNSVRQIPVSELIRKKYKCINRNKI